MTKKEAKVGAASPYAKIVEAEPANDGLSTQYFNRNDPFLPPVMDSEGMRSFEEVVSLYYPYGPMRSFMTYFRPGQGLPMYVGHGQYFDFDYILSKSLNMTGLNTGFGAQVYGGGKGYDLFGMLASSMGEGVERVLGSLAYLAVSDSIIRGSYTSLKADGRNPMHPEMFQFQTEVEASAPTNLFDPWDESSELGWLPGRHLFSGEEILVPAQLVLLFYTKQQDEPYIGLAPSGGLSSHISRSHALFHGICELFERDGVNLRWYTGIPLDRIVLDRPVRDKRLQRLLDALDRDAGEMRFYYHNLDTGELPVVTAIQYDPWYKRYGYYAGGGVGLDIDRVLLSSLTELSQAERSLKVSLASEDWEYSDAFGQAFDIHEDATNEQFSNFIQVVPYYGFKSNQDKARWYFEDGDEIPLSSLPTMEDHSIEASWARLRNVLQTRGWDPIVFDFTPQGFDQTAVMKVLIPQLTSPFPPSTPALGHERYYTVPVATGYRSEPIQVHEMTTDPLPYP